MNAHQALGRGGIAATAGIFLGLATAIAVLAAGGTWILARTRRAASHPAAEQAGDLVPVAAPTRRAVS